MSNNVESYVLTKRKLSILISNGHEKCSHCEFDFEEGDSVVPSGKKKFHYKCAKLKGLV